MPNWCIQKIEATGDNLNQLYKDLTETYKESNYELAVHYSKLFFLYGFARQLLPVVSISFDGYPDIIGDVGENNDENLAFTEWVGIIATDRKLTKDTIQRILALGKRVDWEAHAKKIRKKTNKKINTLFNRGKERGIFHYHDSLEKLICKEAFPNSSNYKLTDYDGKEYIPFNLTNIIPLLVAEELNAYDFDHTYQNSGIQGRNGAYYANQARIGTKWPLTWNKDWVIERDENDNIIRLVYWFKTPWSPVTGVCEELSYQYRCSITCTYCEMGMNFTGYVKYIFGNLYGEEVGRIEFNEYSDDELDEYYDEHGKYPDDWVKSPVWLKDFTDYGG